MQRKRIVLVHPKTGPAFYSAPFNLLILATCLEEAGYGVDLVDCRLNYWDRRLRTLLDRGDVLYVGVTAMTGPQISHALTISRYVKENYGLPVVWGGIHASSLPIQTVSHPLVDLVAIGWADRSIVAFTEVLAAGGDHTDLAGIPGLAFKTPEGKAISTGPRPVGEIRRFTPYAWHLIDPKHYVVDDVCKGRTFSMFTSRGCPHQCTFCYGPGFHGRRWIPQTPEEVLADVDHLRARADFESIYFHDDLFCVDRKRVAAIARGLKERGLYFGVSLRADYFSDDFCRMLEENNCVRIDWGAESGSDRMLQIYKKGATVADTLRGVALGKKYGFSGQVGMITGHPLETAEDLRRSLDLMDEIKRINPNQRVGDVKILTPYPGSEFYHEAIRHGFQPPDSLEAWADFYWNNATMPWLEGRKKELEVISFTSLLVFMGWRMKRPGSPLYNLLIELFRKIEYLRWKRRWFRYAFEIRLMKRYLDLINESLKGEASTVPKRWRWLLRLFEPITEYPNSCQMGIMSGDVPIEMNV